MFFAFGHAMSYVMISNRRRFNKFPHFQIVAPVSAACSIGGVMIRTTVIGSSRYLCAYLQDGVRVGDQRRPNVCCRSPGFKKWISARLELQIGCLCALCDVARRHSGRHYSNRQTFFVQGESIRQFLDMGVESDRQNNEQRNRCQRFITVACPKIVILDLHHLSPLYKWQPLVYDLAVNVLFSTRTTRYACTTHFLGPSIQVRRMTLRTGHKPIERTI